MALALLTSRASNMGVEHSAPMGIAVAAAECLREAQAGGPRLGVGSCPSGVQSGYL